jgi:hypothetical protein
MMAMHSLRTDAMEVVRSSKVGLVMAGHFTQRTSARTFAEMVLSSTEITQPIIVTTETALMAMVVMHSVILRIPGLVAEALLRLKTFAWRLVVTPLSLATMHAKTETQRMEMAAARNAQLNLDGTAQLIRFQSLTLALTFAKMGLLSIGISLDIVTVKMRGAQRIATPSLASIALVDQLQLLTPAKKFVAMASISETTPVTMEILNPMMAVQVL